MSSSEPNSTLSREELEGLLGKSRAQAGAAGEANVPNDTDGALAPRDADSREAPDVRSGDPAGEAAVAADTVAELQMVLRHWERTVAGLQQELIELRSRISRLEQQVEPAEAEPVRRAAVDRADPAPPSAPALADEEPSVLSRVHTHRSRRGWF
ncbi:hypothetical protein [Cohnella sp. 56]|uniref:hypothetical protein n=1 Tax=Cohnella sp. 56 TaxID=3113722 RepID=UPI0030E80F90